MLDAELAYNFSGSTYDQVATFTYTPASQIASRTSIDAFSHSLANEDKTETPNGLNQLTAQGSTGLTYDGMGNVQYIGSAYFDYTSENRMGRTPAGWMAYDQLGRLFQKQAATAQMFDSLGSQFITQHDGYYQPVERYVWGPGQDELLVTYAGTSMGTRSWAYQDERNSVVALADDSGAVTTVNKYDDYGVPASGNAGRFQYTGQAWLPEIGMSYYKARMYAPGLGRFMQTDPIGMTGGINLYAYADGDPTNHGDPSGLLVNPINPHVKPIDPIYAGSLTSASYANVFGILSRTFLENRDGSLTFVGQNTRYYITENSSSSSFQGFSNFSATNGHGVGGVGERVDRAAAEDSRTTSAIAQRAGSKSAQDWCGSKGSEGVPDGNWGEACRLHDECYGTPGAVKEVCDATLALNMTADCSGKIYIPALCAVPGLLYGGGLMILGWTPFYHPARDAYNAAQHKK